MRVARIGNEHFIDVYSTSKSTAFRNGLLAELETICAASHVPILVTDPTEKHLKSAAECWVGILVIDRPVAALTRIEKLMASMGGHRNLILVLSDTLPEQMSGLAGLRDGCFACKDLSNVLQPIRQLTAGTGLIGIDLADFFTVRKGRLTRPIRVKPRELPNVLRSASPFDGVLVSFPVSMDLQEIDNAVDRIKALLPGDYDLLYHDPQTPGSELCDVGLAYQLRDNETDQLGARDACQQ